MPEVFKVRVRRTGKQSFCRTKEKYVILCIDIVITEFIYLKMIFPKRTIIGNKRRDKYRRVYCRVIYFGVNNIQSDN